MKPRQMKKDGITTRRSPLHNRVFLPFYIYICIVLTFKFNVNKIFYSIGRWIFDTGCHRRVSGMSRAFDRFQDLSTSIHGSKPVLCQFYFNDIYKAFITSNLLHEILFNLSTAHDESVITMYNFICHSYLQEDSVIKLFPQI